MVLHSALLIMLDRETGMKLIGRRLIFQLGLKGENLKEGWQSYTFNKILDINSILEGKDADHLQDHDFQESMMEIEEGIPAPNTLTMKVHDS
ncbi:hypothetical protein NC651_034563 [Populus alba x Populus x berolinensis]|nr:hypothetical protein NC651_034563 [Populus alba x Populus x berolinensis]